MIKKNHVTVTDLRGYGRLAVDATLGLTSLVETMHHNILRTPGLLGESTQKPAGGITGFVYKSIRGVTRLVGGSIDIVLSRLGTLLKRSDLSHEREAVVAALNGVLGDHLQDSANPLAIAMRLRRAGKPLELTSKALHAAIPVASGKILLLVHGLCMNDLQWRRNGHDHGAALAADAGWVPIYLHYNSGLHVSSNGRAFAVQIEKLLHAWPVPLEQLVIVAHSMGGLVARSAYHHGTLAGHHWPPHLRKVVFLGTPHLGAPLERGGHWIDLILGASPYTTAFARLGKIRSAGITDLRHGSIVDVDHDRFRRSPRKPTVVPLPHAVMCYAIAASIAKKTGEPAKALLGDGLVPLASALGQHEDAHRDLSFPKTRRWVGYGMNHMDLLDRKSVYAKIKQWLRE